MTLLPQAEHQIGALEKRRKRLLRAGLDVQEVNRQFLLPRLSQLDWQALLQPSEPVEGCQFLTALLDLSSSPALTRDCLEELSRKGLGYVPVLRTRPADPFCSGHQPVAPELLEKRLSRYFDWTESPAFSELQPLLQLTVTQLRLFELLPFGNHSEMLSFWFGAVPLIATGYLIPAYDEGHVERLRVSLAQGFAFSTDPLVGLNLDAALRSYELADELIC